MPNETDRSITKWPSASQSPWPPPPLPPRPLRVHTTRRRNRHQRAATDQRSGRLLSSAPVVSQTTVGEKVEIGLSGACIPLARRVVRQRPRSNIGQIGTPHPSLWRRIERVECGSEEPSTKWAGSIAQRVVGASSRDPISLFATRLLAPPPRLLPHVRRITVLHRIAYPRYRLLRRQFWPQQLASSIADSDQSGKPDEYGGNEQGGN
jgi:hypothetical protein